MNGVPAILTHEGLLTWNVNSWSPLPPEDEIPLSQLSSSHEGFTLTALPTGTATHLVAHLIPPNWYRKSNAPLLVDAVAGSESLQMIAYRYRLEIANNSPQDTNVKPTLLCSFAFQDGTSFHYRSDCPDLLGLVSGPVVDDKSQVFLYSVLETGLELPPPTACGASTTSGPDSATGPAPFSTAVLTRVHDDGRGQSVCTASGRIASITEIGTTYGYVLLDEYLSYHPSTSYSE